MDSMRTPPRIWVDYRPVRIGWVVPTHDAAERMADIGEFAATIVKDAVAPPTLFAIMLGAYPEPTDQSSDYKAGIHDAFDIVETSIAPDVPLPRNFSVP
jgi:hypothetical protein